MLNLFFRFGKNSWSVYEIYPQSDMPHLTQIAHLDFECIDNLYLLPGKVIWYGISLKGIVFRVWDYRVNHSTSFSLDIPQGFDSRPEVHFTFPKALKLLLTHSLVGNCDIDLCHRRL